MIGYDTCAHRCLLCLPCFSIACRQGPRALPQGGAIRKFCGQCGAPLAYAAARFCDRCGQRFATPALPPKRRWPWLVLGLVVAFVAITGWWLLRPDPPPAQSRAPTLTPPPRAPTPTAALPAPSASDALRVHIVDVGQGDGILIQAPDGTTVVIDGGYEDAGMAEYLRSQGITRIDALIASHPHADHIGGQIPILKQMSVGGVWASGASHTTSIYEAWLDAIIAGAIPYHEVATGDTITVGSLNFAVLYGVAAAADLNDTSLVLKLTYGSWSMLFTGDAEGPTESVLLTTVGDELPATVLKVGHHGSFSSSGSTFLAAVQPEIAVYSAGQGNSYGHPDPFVIANLCAAGAKVHGTDQSGTLIITTDGSQHTIHAERRLTDGCMR